ncbi:MAG: DUF1003 domain-containing protein [Candidatus Moranbacteria bacterium]|nr:DUF1003 domain-containing protein [Candidatus Moranbacteria bacterium]
MVYFGHIRQKYPMNQVESTNESPEQMPGPLEDFAFAAIRSVGSIPSLVVHTILFVGIFALQFFGFGFDQIMLILTTIVSLEAIYLSIFIQMSVNRQAARIEAVSEDVEDISEDVEEISKDIDTIQEEVKEIGEEVEDISEDVEDIGEEIEKDDKEDSAERTEDLARLAKIETTLEELLRQVRDMEKK